MLVESISSCALQFGGLAIEPISRLAYSNDATYVAAIALHGLDLRRTGTTVFAVGRVLPPPSTTDLDAAALLERISDELLRALNQTADEIED